MKTLQQIYDAGLAHIRAQGKPSMLDGVCKYRMTDSAGTKLKCIIGGLIPDELYDSYWDSNGGSTVATELPANVLGVIFGPDTRVEFNFMRAMQHAHDKAAMDILTARHPVPFMQGFEGYMRKVAEKYGLVYTAP